MFSSWYDCLSRSANWWTIGLVFLIVLVCMAGFKARYAALQRETEIGNEKLLDGRWWYTPKEAATLLENLGKQGGRFYAVTELTLDLIFPFAYGLFFAFLLVSLWPRDQSWLLLFPLVAVIADLLENLTVAILAWTYDGKPSALAKPAAVFTLTKQIFVALTILAIVIGLVRWAWYAVARAFRGPGPAGGGYGAGGYG